DAEPLGDSWLQRWDSLQLFTPRRFSGLPGLPFPAGTTRSPSRIEMADYLRAYAAEFSLPVRTAVRAERVTRTDTGFALTTSAGPLTTRQVVLATGPFRLPYVPAAAQGLDRSVRQLHSFHYHRPSDLPSGQVLVVGGGNSAAQLALELAATHEVTVASPGPLWFLPEDVLGVSMYWWTLLTGVLNAGGDARVSRYIRGRGDAIVGRQLQSLIRQGRVRLLPHRVISADGDHVGLADGSRVQVETVLWCTGFRPDTGWIDVPGALDDTGAPLHEAGASPVPGLHWMGLPWQTRLNSSIIDGVDRDARRTARRVLAGLPSR
ncbi:MAG: NAD(P)-binding domain-containing protein, partial [Frankiales bacterium]|nr:NAD(P)-binding domain-containing protein [Frankiales bacterium]